MRRSHPRAKPIRSVIRLTFTLTLAIALTALAATPLTFEENPAGFIARAQGFDVRAMQTRVELSARGPNRLRAGFAPTLDGARTVQAVPENLQPGTHSRFVGARETWVQGARLFSQVRYAGVYDGIDWVLHATGSALEMDFALAPFADVRAIRLRATGARMVSLSSGRVVFELAGQKVELQAPRAFQDGKPVTARYVRRGSTLGFELGAYDHSRPVIVDPIAATVVQYLGGSSDDLATAVALDGLGFIYIAGQTASTDFVTTGTSSYIGGYDIFVSKLDANDGGLVYSTYVGGSADDTQPALALDAERRHRGRRRNNDLGELSQRLSRAQLRRWQLRWVCISPVTVGDVAFHVDAARRDRGGHCELGRR